MQLHNMSAEILAASVLAAVSRTASVNSSSFAAKPGYSRMSLVLTLGSHDHTTGDETLDVKLQESTDNGSTWTDVTGGAFAQIAAQTIPATGYIAMMDVNMERRAPLLRVVGTAAGTTPIDVYGVNAYWYRGGVTPRVQDVTPIYVEQ